MGENKTRFGTTLKELRLSRQMTQEKMAELIEKSASTVGQLERGDIYPHYETLVKIIEVLNVDANLFFFRETSQHSDVTNWLADVFIGLNDSERKEFGMFLAKLSRVMLKK